MTNPRILELVDIFSDLTSQQLERIFSLCKEQIYTQNTLIFAENTPSTEIYVVLDGEVEILVGPDQAGEPPRRIAVTRTGQCFGEIALVDMGRRSASARCLSETCRLLVIDRDDFMKLLRQDYEIGFAIMYNLAAELCLKIRQTTFLVRETLLYSPGENPQE